MGRLFKEFDAGWVVSTIADIHAPLEFGEARSRHARLLFLEGGEPEPGRPEAAHNAEEHPDGIAYYVHALIGLRCGKPPEEEDGLVVLFGVGVHTFGSSM